MNQLTETSEMDFRVAVLQSVLNTEHLKNIDVLEAINLIGLENVQHLLNDALSYSGSEVKIDLTLLATVKEVGCYRGLSLECHELIIPKYSHDSITSEAIKKKFKVNNVLEEDESHGRIYKVYLGEERFVTTMSQIILTIRMYLLPFIKKRAKKLKLSNYRMVFVVDAVI